MKEFQSVDEVLDFAIEREQEAFDFYGSLAKQAKRPGMSELFTQFAKEELGHKSKLQGIKKGKLMMGSAQKVTDLKIGDYLVEVKPSADLDFQQSLILAMKKEKAAFKLYTNLAALVSDSGLRDTFLALAQEEAKHKLRFELEYDDLVLTEN